MLKKTFPNKPITSNLFKGTFPQKKKVFVHLSKFPIVATGKSITPINCDKHCPPVRGNQFQPSRGKPTKSAEILDRKPRITLIVTSSSSKCRLGQGKIFNQKWSISFRFILREGGGRMLREHVWVSDLLHVRVAIVAFWRKSPGKMRIKLCFSF